VKVASVRAVMSEGKSILGRTATAAAPDICVGWVAGFAGMAPLEQKVRMGGSAKTRVRIKEDR